MINIQVARGMTLNWLFIFFLKEQLRKQISVLNGLLKNYAWFKFKYTYAVKVRKCRYALQSIWTFLYNNARQSKISTSILTCYFKQELIKIKQNTAISKHFTKPKGYTRTTSGTIFRADVQISGGQVILQYKPGAYLQNLSLLIKIY